MSNNVEFSFSRAIADTKSRLRLVGYGDDQDNRDPTLLFTYDHEAHVGNNWYFDDPKLQLAVKSLAAYTPHNEGERSFVAITIAAEVAFYGALSQREIVNEIIPDAGLFLSNAHLGYMECIKQIGNHLYATGANGQIYRRDSAEFGKGNWEHVDKKFFDLIQTRKQKEGLIIYPSIGGTDESNIYFPSGKGIVAHWNGNLISELQTASSQVLADIFVEKETNIWICGNGGVVLCGNHRDGFTAPSGLTGTHQFRSITMLNNMIYIASVGSGKGLFQYDGRRLSRVKTGLTPEITDVHTVTCSEGVLWSVGHKDIVRFDGNIWERIPFPGNAPVK